MNTVWRNRWSAGLIWLAAACLGPALVASAPAAQAEMSARVASAQAIPFTRAEVESRDGQTFTVAWSAPGGGAIEVYARTTPGPSPEARLVGRGGANGQVTVIGLPSADRWYFELRPRRGGALVTADHSLHLKTAPNFRDVGGYRTRDGRWVRMGLVYRSDQLDRLSDADLARIARLAPGLIVDLRTEAERKQGPDRLAPGAAPMVADVIAGAPSNGAAFSKVNSPEAAAAFLTDTTRMFVSLPSAKDAYSRLFAQLQTPDVTVYHCTAGKDRTGWATAVLLTALGVPRETVMADYLASNGYLADKNRAMFSRLPPATAANLEPVMTVRAAYLEAAFAEVDKRYGSFDRYLRDGLGLDRAALNRLRGRFLAGAPQG
jgi:protein-tyrosine phosphatase